MVLDPAWRPLVLGASGFLLQDRNIGESAYWGERGCPIGPALGEVALTGFPFVFSPLD